MSTHALREVLAPFPLDDFFREHWGRRPLHVAGPPDKFRHLFENADRAAGLLAGATHVKAAYLDERGKQIEMPIDPRQSLGLFQAGLTICANVSESPVLAPFFARFRQAFRMPGGPLYAKLYISKDTQGYPIHFDKFHVFVLQLDGRKQWWFDQGPVVDAPLEGGDLDVSGRPVWVGTRQGEPLTRDDGTPVAPPDRASFESVRLETGHMLYVPPGTWHTTRAIGHSIGLSISPPRSTAADLVGGFVADLLLQRGAAWRRDILARADAESPPGSVPKAAADEIDARVTDLRSLVAGLDGRSLQRAWQLETLGPADDVPNPGDVRISPDDTLAHVGEVPFEFLAAPAPDGRETLFVYAGGREWTLPTESRAFLTELCKHRKLKVSAALRWDERLPRDAAIELLTVLVKVGLLERR